MPIRKIADVREPRRCNDPSHEPPTMIVLKPGTYEHTCPKCGAAQTFVIRREGLW